MADFCIILSQIENQRSQIRMSNKPCYHLLFLCFFSIALSGCSVYKAASNEGVNVSDIENCTTRSCFLCHGMKILTEKEEKNGQHTEVYKAVARKSGINYVRAAGHGALDVMTLGLWEIVGTPVEGAISNNRGYIIAKATYPHKNSDTLIKLDVYDADGQNVVHKG